VREFAASDPKPTRTRLLWLLGTVVVAIVIRILIWRVSHPVLVDDSGEYLSLARQIRALDLSADIGMRTPVYPVLLLMLRQHAGALAVVQQHARLLVAFQMLLGTGIVTLLFLTAYRLTGSRSLAALAGILYAVALPQIFFESAMLTETSATFLVVAAGALIVRCSWPERRCTWLSLLALAACVGLAALERPAFAFLPVLVAVPVAYCSRRWRRTAVFALLALAPLLLWSTYNLTRFGVFEPTTTTGYNLTNHVGAYFQDAPASQARDVYLRARASRGGDHIMAIWYAVVPMMRATGETFPQLGRTLLSIDLRLIASHPGLYAESVARSAWDFWKGSSVPHDWLATDLSGLDRPWQYVTWIMNALFFACVVVGLVLIGKRRGLRGRLFAVAWLAAIPMSACVVQALMEAGENARYGMPTQPLTWLVALVGAWWVAERLRDRRDPAPVPDSERGE